MQSLLQWKSSITYSGCVLVALVIPHAMRMYRGVEKSLARPTSRCILFHGENISFDTSLIYIYIYIYICVCVCVSIYIYIYIVLMFLQL